MSFDPLLLAARHGRWVLIGGLAVGLGVPALAQALRPWVPEMVAVLLFLGALRMGTGVFAGLRAALPATILAVLVLQLALPLAVIGLAAVFGLLQTPALLGLAVMCAAPSIVGSPNMCLMMGAPPAFAMRLLVAGTALLPLTVLPVFWFLPELGSPGAVLAAVGRLIAAIVLASGLALAVRRIAWRDPGPVALARLDGLSALALAIFVVGLMPALRAVLDDSPATMLAWLALVVVANFGLQLITWRAMRGRDAAVPLALIAGNRNIALFLVALPEQVTAPLMVFIGCYQIPMFLTPLVMGRLYRR